jgi:tetratricopeptide (TPR) repeat protein
VSYTQKLIPAERALGNLYAARGRIDLGTKHLRAAVEYGDRLTLVEPNNTNWLALAAKAKINLAEFLLLGGAQGEATASNEAGCSMFGRLVAKDSTMPEWRAGLRDCWMMRAQLAMANKAMADAVSASQHAVQIARLVRGTDREADRYLQAKAYRLLGDARQRSGDSNGARAAWQTAFAVLPTGVSERPGETKIREEVMQRLGRNAEAQQMTKKLAAIGYLYPSPRT